MNGKPLCVWIETEPSVLTNAVSVPPRIFQLLHVKCAASLSYYRLYTLTETSILFSQSRIAASSQVAVWRLLITQKWRNGFARQEDTSEKAEVCAVMPWRGDVSYSAPVNNRPVIKSFQYRI